MRTTFFVSLGLLICAATAQAAPLPGTPLSGTFGTIDITEPPEVSVSNPASQPFEFQPGTTAPPTFTLPGPVTEGDLILQEGPTFEVTAVSDVVRFTNVQTAAGPVGEATLFSGTDEAHGGFGLGALPGGPLSNQKIVDEAVEPTVYQVPGATYRVFSDAEVPEPSTGVMVTWGVVGLALSGRQRRS